MTGGEQGQGHDLGGLDWRDGVIPVSRRFDDPYFSLNDGLAETGHVFLAGNNLPARLTPGFQVAELGFGTGLNLLALHLCNPGHPIRFTSFEAFPLDALDMVGSLGTGGGLVALVMAPDKVTYRVRPGAYLGQSDGRITGVQEDRIELVELVPDGAGGWRHCAAHARLRPTCPSCWPITT